MKLRAAYSAIPLRHRLAIRQLRRVLTGKGRSLQFDHPNTAREAWQARYRDEGENWTKLYWEDFKAPQRLAMLNVLKGLDPFRSLIELGCNSGPNLRLIRQQFPDCQLTGIDVVAETIEAGRRYFNQAGINGVTLKQGTFDCSHGYHDVALTMWALTCSPPREIGRVLDSIEARTIVVVEPSCEGESRLHLDCPTWKHDYARLLADRGFEVETIPCELEDVESIFVAKMVSL